MAGNFKKNITILLIWLILSLIIIAISAIFVYFRIVNIEEKSPYIYGCSILLFILLGFLSGNIKHKKGLLNGMVMSLFIVIILLLIQFLGLAGKIDFGLVTKYIVFLLSGGLGGIFGVNFKPLAK